MERFDVLVVGGGPAGATCAYELSGGGLRVLLVDIKRRIGTPVQCAEFVPVQLAHQFKAFFPQEAVVQRVKNMLHFTPWGQTVSMWSEGYMLDREVFDYHIAELSRQRGAKVLLRTRFLGFEGDIVWLERLDRRETFPVKVDFVVGADGPRSRVARLTGKGTENFLTTAQVTLPLVERLEDLLVYFREYIPGGYGWLFPKGQVANVGVGVDPYFSVNVVESLKRLVEELVAEGLVENKVLKRTGGWIPAEGLLKLVRGRVVLVGDAGGFCHPITGGGIANAVLSGHMAGRAILEGRPQDLEEEAQDLFGDSLRRAAEKRKKHMKRWDNLREIIPKTWIAFEEYWRTD